MVSAILNVKFKALACSWPSVTVGLHTLDCTFRQFKLKFKFLQQVSCPTAWSRACENAPPTSPKYMPLRHHLSGLRHGPNLMTALAMLTTAGTRKGTYTAYLA